MNEPRRTHDDAENIRRLSPGDRNVACDDATVNSNRNTIGGGFFVGIIAVAIALWGAGSAWQSMGEIATLRDEIASMRAERAVASAEFARMSADAAVAAERADKAERSAALSRLYAAQVYPELARLGLAVNTPAGSHEPVPAEAYDNHDRFVEERSP